MIPLDIRDINIPTNVSKLLYDLHDQNEKPFDIKIEEKIYQLIVKKNRSWFEEIKIQKQYLKDNPVEEEKEILNEIYSGLIGGGMGFFASATFVIIELAEATILPVWAIVRTIFLFLFGYSIGFAVAKTYTIYKINRSSIYLNWKLDIGNKESFNRLSHCVKEDEYLKGRVCPITRELILNPVIARCGHIFEDSAIKDWLKNNSACPCCRRNTLASDLRFADNYCISVCARIQKIIPQVKDNKIRVGLISYLDSKYVEENDLLTKRLASYESLYNSGSINSDQLKNFREMVTKIQNLWLDCNDVANEWREKND